jgi:hypothetical protein
VAYSTYSVSNCTSSNNIISSSSDSDLCNIVTYSGGIAGYSITNLQISDCISFGNNISSSSPLTSISVLFFYFIYFYFFILFLKIKMKGGICGYNSLTVISNCNSTNNNISSSSSSNTCVGFSYSGYF